jgi:DNA-binding response OmpR family regulator
MPRKNGFVSLGEIKRNTDLQDFPIIIFSTASDEATVNNVFKDAAHYYICKPPDFSQLKKVIYEALMLITQKNIRFPLKENFLISGDSIIIPDSK